MHKEDVNIVPQLRKKYRLYIGQGIPNPWTSYCYVDDSEILSSEELENSRKYICYLPRSKRSSLNENLKKELCFCCKRKFLFECPDKYYKDSQLCTCKSCHGSNTSTECSKKCRCIEILQKWVLKNAILKQKKKQIEKVISETGYSSPNASDSGGDDEVKYLNEEKAVQCCEHLKNQKACPIDSASEKSAEEKPFKSNGRSKVLTKTQCSCPYMKNICLRKSLLKNNATNNGSEFVASASKLVQAELQPVRFSKTVQTENSETETRPKCDCTNKCSQCSFYRCKAPWVKPGFPVMHSISSLCFPYGCPQNTAFVCPCFFSSNCILHKFCKHECNAQKERNKKKQQKVKDNKDDWSGELKANQKRSKVDENDSGDAKYDFEVEKPTKIYEDDSKNKTNIYYLPSVPITLDHLKYLTDEKIKSVLQPEEISSSVLSNRFSQQLSHSGSRLRSFCKGDASFYNLRPDRIQLEKFNSYSNYIPRHSESSFVESKVSFRENNLQSSNTRMLNYSDQATMTKNSKNDDDLTKVRFFKELVESDESRTFGLASKRDLCTKAMRKRRRLLANRKRRKKLAASGKVSFLEYQAFLNKLPKKSALVNKHVQVEQTASDIQNMKKTFLFPLDTMNSDENNCLRFKNATFTSGRYSSHSYNKVDKEISSQNLSKLNGNNASEETFKPPLRPEFQFCGVFEKMSNNKGSSWTSSALKNFVNDLITEKNIKSKIKI